MPESVAEGSKSTPAFEADDSKPAAEDTDVAATLTPEVAKVTVSSEGALILESEQSLDELKAFYEDAVKTLGAKQSMVSEEMGWEYMGTYGDDKPLVIAITDMMEEGTFTITIAY